MSWGDHTITITTIMAKGQGMECLLVVPSFSSLLFLVCPLSEEAVHRCVCWWCRCSVLSSSLFPVVWMLRDPIVCEVGAEQVHDPSVVGPGVELQRVDVLEQFAELHRAAVDQVPHSLASHISRLVGLSTFLVVSDLKIRDMSSCNQNAFTLQPTWFMSLQFDHGRDPL